MLDVHIFRIFGLIYLLVGLGFIFDFKYYKEMLQDFFKNKTVLYVFAIMALLTGFLLITYHNVWTGGWSVVITVLGWLAFLKGAVALVFPSFFMKMANFWIKKGYGILSRVCIILGLFFFVLSFVL